MHEYCCHEMPPDCFTFLNILHAKHIYIYTAAFVQATKHYLCLGYT